MWDFEKIAEISYLVNELNQILVLENGMVITKENLEEYLNQTNDA